MQLKKISATTEVNEMNIQESREVHVEFTKFKKIGACKKPNKQNQKKPNNKLVQDDDKFA